MIARVRPAAVAGSFYPDDPDALRVLLDLCLATAVPPLDDAPVPAGIVVPHAGLMYSVSIAASAYLRVAPAAGSIGRILLLGPSHRVGFAGVAATRAEAFDTPLGPVAVDTGAVAAALAVPGVAWYEAAHAFEHSLEVQLPFIRTLLPDVPIVPFVVGDAPMDEVVALLDELWREDDDTLLVVSTDLSHYHPAAEAAVLDRRTAGAIVSLRPDAIGAQDACGCRPLRGLLAAAAGRHLVVEQLDLRTSADTAGDPDRVVGYGAFAVA